MAQRAAPLTHRCSGRAPARPRCVMPRRVRGRRMPPGPAAPPLPAELCLAVLRGDGSSEPYRGRIFLGCDGSPITFDVGTPGRVPAAAGALLLSPLPALRVRLASPAPTLCACPPGAGHDGRHPG